MLEAGRRGTRRSGNHTSDAWILLVPGTSRVRDVERPARLVDVAATVCALLGADRAGRMTGDPLLEPAGARSRSPDQLR